MKIRKLHDQDARVETGPVQFGNDWPGVFIRGDHAGYYAMTLRAIIEGGYGKQEDAIAEIQLRGLQELFAGAVVGPAAKMVKTSTTVGLVLVRRESLHKLAEYMERVPDDRHNAESIDLERDELLAEAKRALGVKYL